MRLEAAGEARLKDYVKDYKKPFKLIVHTSLTATGGTPIPSGDLDFYIRPTVTLSILK
jgi:hypothetical protein